MAFCLGTTSATALRPARSAETTTKVIAAANCRLLCLRRESDAWHAPGRRSELCHYALERRRALRAYGCARGGKRARAVVRNVLAANLQLYPAARLLSR